MCIYMLKLAARLQFAEESLNCFKYMTRLFTLPCSGIHYDYHFLQILKKHTVSTFM